MYLHVDCIAERGKGGFDSSALKQRRFSLAEKPENAVCIRYGSGLREGGANGG